MLNCFLIVNAYQVTTVDSDLQFALPKARSNSGAKMIKHSAIEIWSRIPLEIKHKTRLALCLEEKRNKKYV